MADAPEAGTKEFFSSWALFIMIALLMMALFTSYILQQRKIEAVHETVLSIFGGMRMLISTQLSVPFDLRKELTRLIRHVCRINPSNNRVAHRELRRIRLSVLL
jgi:hypothetical protein